MYGVIVSDGFPFLKEIGQKLVKDLVQSFESDTSSGPFRQDVVDFSAFLQPILSLIEKKLAAAASSRIAKEKTDPLADEVNHLFLIFSDLLCWIDKCLHKLELCLALNSDVEIYTSRWSQCLAILKELHSISRLYPGSDDRFQTTMRQYKAGIRILILKYAKRADDNSWLIKHKDALDFESKRHLAMLLFPEVTEDYDELFEMLIDRSNLLAESYEYIYKAESSSLHAGLFMQFKDEEATGPECPVCFLPFRPSKYFKFSGKVVALALMHKIQVGVVLDRIFFLQLAGRRVSLEDIRDADPCIYNSCKKILEMDTDFVDSDALGLTFVTEVEELGTIKSVELCSGGKDIAVNSRNRRKYVDLIVQHHFVTSIADQVSSFAKGFRDILNYGVFHGTFFKSLELEDLDWMLHGSESEICVEDWMSHTEYNGYEKSDPQIVWFWEVVRNLSPEQRKTLLFFWTSIKYLPIEGFRGLASRLYIYKSSDPEDFLPSSHTCFYQLCIPPYPSRDVMRQRLLVITQQHVGCSFGTY
ncbi:E3 ubiquitin-protein ligase UPL5 [Bienertia sinuspersici]